MDKINFPMHASSSDGLYVPPGGPPQEGPSREIYARMGEAAIFRMCADFYRRLDVSPIRPMFPVADMAAASQKLAAFLVGVLGGPPLFHERYGPPRMRARHFPFPIDEHARRVWLDNFLEVLTDAERAYGFPPEHLPGFKKFLEDMSAWMVNQKPKENP